MEAQPTMGLALAEVMPDGQGGWQPVPSLMTEAELIRYLRVEEITKAEDPHHVIQWLKRMRGLPCTHISKQPLYFLPAVREWIQREVEQEQRR